MEQIAFRTTNNLWISGREAIGECFTNFYNDLFHSTSPSIPFDLANLISPVITLKDTSVLDTISIVEEIVSTVKSLGFNKAPGLDDLPTLFYKECWDIVCSNVIVTVQDFFNTGQSLSHLTTPF